MTVIRLDPQRAAALRAAPFSYPEVGATATGLPDGYHHLSRTVTLMPGEASLRRAADALLSWQVQSRAGSTVAAAPPEPAPTGAGLPRVQAGTVVEMKLGLGPLSVRAPARVVYVVDEPRRIGFAYGTLRGHPEIGEESFVLDMHDDDSVTFTVSAFSRPGTLLTRLGGPIARQVQKFMTTRYLRALQPPRR